jgi:hypothetical protein
LAPYEYISKSHSNELYRFLLNPSHQMPRLNILGGSAQDDDGEI